MSVNGNKGTGANGAGKDGVDDNASNPRLILGASDDVTEVIEPAAEDRSATSESDTDAGNREGSGGPVSRPVAPTFHKRSRPEDPIRILEKVKRRISGNMLYVIFLTLGTNILILAVPLYLFQISDRVLTSRSIDTLVMLTVVIAGAIVIQAALDAIRRFVLMRTAVDVATRLGPPVLASAAQASLHSNGREYQTLGDLQTLRGFLVSGTLLSFLDVPFVPLFIFAIFLIHPHLGLIVIVTALVLALLAYINQKITSEGFKEANVAQVRANLHLESMSRNSQIINAMAMIPEAVRIWGADTAASLKSQIKAQDRNIVTAAVSRMCRLLAQIGMLGWGAWLALDGQMTGGMVIAASIVAGRALAPIEGSIEGWNSYLMARGAYDRVSNLMARAARSNDKLRLPNPEGRLDVERLLFVPAGTKNVVLNALTFTIGAGERLAIIGNSGAGKTTLGKMLVGSILPTSGAVRLDLMDLRNWDPRQLGECVGYLPQDVQLFPGTIKANIARMRADASDEAIYRAAMLADVHDMIADLPQGYETVVAADGAPLSGGQKQRIGLARAFFGDPKFLVLDEPNSNLDTHGDAALVRALGHAKDHRITTIVISQKPNILTSVDKIMVLDTGHISMFGWRDKVLKDLADRRAARQSMSRDTNTPLEGAPA
ncbi:type I secretion system permease/ATPase [uncultured Maritimibacter sp.]|jgi:ATP-binding cassette subfamily C protein|uniref:type I secretion system permease/ATPase n=1 Tax=uncultured Maritimibacter sp. TaxID=991866 RepID=UPI000AD978E3|nr:type I secretion system permease/ATPase [uncultured Maritimibacter sp.]